MAARPSGFESPLPHFTRSRSFNALGWRPSLDRRRYAPRSPSSSPFRTKTHPASSAALVRTACCIEAALGQPHGVAPSPLGRSLPTPCSNRFADQQPVLRRDLPGDRLRPDSIALLLQAQCPHHIHGQRSIHPPC